MESKLGEPLFDQIVAAFKVNGQIIEVGRTTNDKTYDDLLRCTKLPSNVEVCFLDDQLHAKMEHARVYYINVKPYVHHLSAETMLNRFLQTPALRSTMRPLPSISNSTLSDQILNFMRKFSGNHAPKHPLEQEVDAIISKKIMEHLKTFFLQKMKSIRKTATSLKMKTPAQSKTMKIKRF
jgi:hypothetical protein